MSLFTHESCTNVFLERQLRAKIAEYTELNNDLKYQNQSLSATNTFQRQAYGTLAQTYNALLANFAQLMDYNGQLAQENASLRATAGVMFSLQHPNNFRRAQNTHQQYPRQSRIETLREPDGGLDLRTRAPPPAPAAAETTKAREGRFGAVDDGRPSSSGTQQGGEGTKNGDAEDGPGPAMVDEE